MAVDVSPNTLSELGLTPPRWRPRCPRSWSGWTTFLQVNCGAAFRTRYYRPTGELDRLSNRFARGLVFVGTTSKARALLSSRRLRSRP